MRKFKGVEIPTHAALNFGERSWWDLGEEGKSPNGSEKSCGKLLQALVILRGYFKSSLFLGGDIILEHPGSVSVFYSVNLPSSP